MNSSFFSKSKVLIKPLELFKLKYSYKTYSSLSKKLYPQLNEVIKQNYQSAHCNSLLKSKFFLTSTNAYSTGTEEELENPLDLFDENDEEKQLVPRSLRTGNSPHQVLIIHPHIKWGAKKRKDTNPELEMEEAESLIRTLDGWKIIGTKKVSLLSYDSHSFFNRGQLESIQDLVKENENISAVFINVKTLRLNQHLFLEDLLKVPIFDRYSIVINIFKRHAVTKEAKLQVALAEIPYIRSRIKGVNETEVGRFTSNSGIGSRDVFVGKRLNILTFHEQKLKKLVLKLRKNRELLRNKRKSLQFPVVAVIGYTNSGKTSLIKCLTEEEKIQPKDKLFATLDVTVHMGILPCNLKVLYLDTIGFISDIPTNLLEPFIATLEDAVQADLIIHVQDISHPNYLKQKTEVMNTLANLNLDNTLIDSIISVGNKCDKVEQMDNIENDTLLVSCKKQTGLSDLELEVEQALVRNMGLQQLRIKVKNGGREYQWLQKEAAIANYIVDEADPQFIFLDVTISKPRLEQFKHYFIRNG